MIENLKRQKINRFINDISKNVDIIKRYYKKIQRHHEKDAIWLSDNYHLFFKAFKGIESTFSKNKKFPLGIGKNPRIYDIAIDYISINGNNFTAESFEDYLLKISFENELQYDEIEVLPDMLKYCYIEIIASAITEKNEIDFYALVSSVRALSDYSFFEIAEKIYSCEDLLRNNSCFENLDENSKFLYRKIINKKAQKEKMTERSYLENIISQSGGRDISFFLFKRKKTDYFLFLVITFFVFFILYSFTVRNLIVILFSIVPIYMVSKVLLDSLYCFIKKSTFIPSVNVNSENCANLVTTVTLLSDFSSIDKLTEKTERCRFSNYDKGFFYGILADLPPSTEEFTESDKEFCEYIKSKIDALNKKYDGEFFVAVRKKIYNEESKKYSGRERKRGAVNDFISALKENDKSKFYIFDGNFDSVKYITVMDDDTLPEIDSIKRLVGVLEHPINKPRYNSSKTSVKFGYGAAVPRIDIRLSSSLKTHFSGLKGNDSGKELYSNSYFSVYQDLFGEGSFSGKGVINIDVFYNVICGLFPENKVLSHDIPEGNLLRCVYVSDVSFYDDIPVDIVSYTERSSRWIRGDIQNNIFLKKTIKNEKRKVVLNPTGYLGKFKIFNNIVESFFYPSLFFLILTSVFYDPSLILISLIFFFFEDILKLLFKLFRPVDLIRLRYRSSKFSAEAVSFLDKFYSFLCLPYIAFCNLKAICTSLYRIHTSTNLLKWTTASNLGGKNRKFTEYLKKLWPQYIGLFLIFSPFLSIMGVLWLSSFFISYLLAKTPKRSKAIGCEGDRKEDLNAMWKYFDTFVNEENSFLPPDNFQEEPTSILARRTSPTNIGLYLVSLLCAYYINIIDYDLFKEKLKKTVDTVKKLKKWNGHLYNWYSTSDLQVLTPAFISTVDNGNFICSVVTLRNALKRIDSECSVIEDLDDIISTTDFSLLYSKKKSLFSVGYDCEKNKLVNSYYDIYASESLLSYYYAITERHISIKAWSKLNRYRYIKNRYSCIKSWSGTMFEYFMPCLFLPVVPKSFNDEMLCGTFYEQEKKNKNGIWGNSESSYYSFDKALNYQYRAFGVQSLAIQRGVNRSNVVSPYSSWLVLPFFPKKANDNLSAFKKIGAFGKYGYYDAVDKTPMRTGGSGVVIKNYMVHHIGMSFIAGVNYLKDNIVVKDFMDEKRQAFSTLLEEKNVSYDKSFAVYPEFSPQKNRVYKKGEEFTVLNPYYPVAKIISNGSLSSCLSDSGNGYLCFENKAVTKRNISADNPMGTFAFFNCDSAFLSATFAPVYDKNPEYKTLYEHGKMMYFASVKEIESKYSVTVSCENSCEIREYKIKNNSVKNKKGKVLFYLEPILCDYVAFNAHPAFSGLFLKGETDIESGDIYVSRRNRETGKNSEWIALSVYVKKNDKLHKIHPETEFSRYNILSRGKGISAIKESFSREFKTEQIPASFCTAIRFPIDLKGKNEDCFYLFTAYGTTKESAKYEMEKTVGISFSKQVSALKARTNAIMERLSIRRMEAKLFDLMYSSVFVKKNYGRYRLNYSSSLKENALWKYGISLQKPIIVIRISDKNKEKVRPFLNALVAMRTFTKDFYAVICFYENGRYDRPLYNYLIDKLILLDGEKYLNDGIYICNIKNFDELALFSSASSFYINLDRDYKYDVKYQKYKKPEEKNVQPIPLKYQYKCGVGGYVEVNGEVCFGIDDKDRVKSRALWSHVFANENFGTVIQENSLGFTYAYNAGLNKITTWSNDPISGCKGERLYSVINGVRYNILEKATSIFGKGWGTFLGKVGNIEFRADVFVPLERKSKIVKVTFKNPDKKRIYFEYGITPLLDENEKFAHLHIFNNKNYMIFSNNFNSNYDGVGYLCVNSGYSRKDGVRSLTVDNEYGEFVFTLGYSDNNKIALSDINGIDLKTANEEFCKVKEYYKNTNGLQLNTPDKKLNLLFAFLGYQAIASRIYSRCGFYQCGGAVGFRDQLQDALCLSGFEPEIFKTRLEAAASRQFVEGDVLHWWHDIKRDNDLVIKGSRTKSSDDLLWLPFAVGEYYEKTLDIEFLKKTVPYVEGESLSAHEKEKYITVFVSSKEDDIYTHAKNAITKGATKGKHGLVLFGSGDWNDGMTNVGADGIGESVWCTFFIILTMKKFLPVIKAFGDEEFEKFINLKISEYFSAIENNCWDGHWYIRGYYDNGSVLGSASSDECKIDVLPQAFASITGGFNKNRVEEGLENANKYLVDDNLKIIKLFYPPFSDSENDPGYIKGYTAGVRENGGQYTHAAVWYMLSLFNEGKIDEAYKVLSYINPIEHTETEEDVSLYKIEPYVLAGDVYMTGMGGWSFYTGSAAWYFKTVTEQLLGIIFRKDVILLSPNLPSDWNGYSVLIRYGGANIEISVRKGGKKEMLVDEKMSEVIPLDGKDHKVDLICGFSGN